MGVNTLPPPWFSACLVCCAPASFAMSSVKLGFAFLHPCDVERLARSPSAKPPRRPLVFLFGSPPGGALSDHRFPAGKSPVLRAAKAGSKPTACCWPAAFQTPDAPKPRLESPLPGCNNIRGKRAPANGGFACCLCCSECAGTAGGPSEILQAQSTILLILAAIFSVYRRQRDS